MGFSIEVGSTPEMFAAGGLGGKPRSSFANLMNVLRFASGSDSGPNIRIGGNSADESVYLPSGTLPTNDTYRITDADLQLYAAAVPAWNGTIVLDLNMRNPTDPTLAVNHVKAAAASIGWDLIEGVEIGNEVRAAVQKSFFVVYQANKQTCIKFKPGREWRFPCALLNCSPSLA